MKTKALFTLVGALFVIFSCTQRSTAQTAPGTFADANHPSGAPDPQKLDEVWQVDPINNAVSIRIPFSTTPVGGRGPKIPFALLYNSTSTVTLQAIGSVVLDDGSHSMFQWSAHPLAYIGSLAGPTGPWTTTGPYFYSQYENISDQGFTDTNGMYHVTGAGCIIYGPYTYVDENGSAHGLDLEGMSSSTTPLASPCSDANSAAAKYWPSSVTADGSGMITGGGGDGHGIGPDGTSAAASTLTDSNGNSASLSTVNGVTTATDALGRTVYKTNIPIGTPGQIPAGSYYVTTYDATGLTPETYTVTFTSIALGSFAMSHPTTSEFLSAPYCSGSSCSSHYTVNQPSRGDTFTAVSEIDRPDGTSYLFSYDATYGTISKINFPTGGYVHFVWSVRDKDWSPYGQFEAISALVVTEVDISDGATENHWIYSMKSLSTSSTPSGTVYAPDGSRTDYTGTCFVYSSVPLYSEYARSNCKESYRAIYNSSGVLLKTISQSFTDEGLPKQVATTIYDGPKPLQQQEVNTYDTWDNVTEKDESDFYTCSGSPCPVPSTQSNWARKTYTSYAYVTNTALANAHIVNKPSQVLVTDGSGVPAALTNYGYDTHGNLTLVSKCISISGSGTAATCASSWQTSNSYDSTGQLTQTIEGYGTSAAATTIYSWGGQQNGFLLSIQHPNGAKDAYTYFTPTGQMASHTDWNGQTTTYDYSDSMHRIRTITAPSTVDGTTGSTGHAVTTYNYADSSGDFAVQEQHTLDTAGTTTSTTKTYDGLGREVRTLSVSPQCSSGIEVDTTYDSMSRVRSVSNPYCSTSDTTYGSTLYLYDALGRKTQTTLPDGAVSAITYAGNATEVTDPFNGTTYVQHIQQVDGLGRLTNVCELSSSPLGSSSPTSCGLAIGGTGYLTTYTYDAQGNMLNVNQHGLSRAFSYDALSRLTQSLNPEVGLNVYTYPSASNPCASSAAVPCTRTDGRGVTTSYTYDALNRVLSKAYSDVATATSCYQYDSASVANGIGRLASAWTQRASAGACSMSAVFLTKRSNIVYDAMGRILSEQQCTPSNCTSGAPYAPIYTYNLAGNLTSYTNGISTTSSVGTLVFTNTYDAADHLQTVTSNWSDGTHPATLFSAQTATTTACPDSMSYPYAAFGGLMNATYGSGITLNRTYDKRLRTTCEIDTGNGTTATRGSATATITGAEQTN